MAFQAFKRYAGTGILFLLPAAAIILAGCSDAPKLVRESGCYGKSDDTIRISRIVVQPGVPDPESRLAAEIVAGKLREGLEGIIPVVHADSFGTPVRPERLAGVLTLELSAFEPVFEPFPQDKARLRLGLRLITLARPRGSNPWQCDLNFMRDSSLSFQQDKEAAYTRPYQRKAALRLAAGKIADDLLKSLRFLNETVPAFSAPDYLYEPPIDSHAYDWAGGTVIQLGSTPHLRRFEVRHFPLAEDRDRQLDRFLELLRNNGYEPGRRSDYSMLYDQTAREIELKGGDDRRAFLTFPPDAEMRKEPYVRQTWNHVRLAFTEAAPPEVPQQAFDRFRREDLRSFACAGGFRRLRGEELAREFDRLAGMPQAAYNELFHLYDDTGDAEQLPFTEARRERLLDRIRDRLIQADSTDFNLGAVGLLNRLGFDKRCTPEQLQKLEPLKPLLIQVDGETITRSQTIVRQHFPLSGPCRFIILATPLKPGWQPYFTAARFVPGANDSGCLEMSGHRVEISLRPTEQRSGIMHTRNFQEDGRNFDSSTGTYIVTEEKSDFKDLPQSGSYSLRFGFFPNFSENRLEFYAFCRPPRKKNSDHSANNYERVP